MYTLGTLLHVIEVHSTFTHEGCTLTCHIRYTLHIHIRYTLNVTKGWLCFDRRCTHPGSGIK